VEIDLHSPIRLKYIVPNQAGTSVPTFYTCICSFNFGNCYPVFNSLLLFVARSNLKGELVLMAAMINCEVCSTNNIGFRDSQVQPDILLRITQKVNSISTFNIDLFPVIEFNEFTFRTLL
jgi:hypothetical protein